LHTYRGKASRKTSELWCAAHNFHCSLRSRSAIFRARSARLKPCPDTNLRGRGRPRHAVSQMTSGFLQRFTNQLLGIAILKPHMSVQVRVENVSVRKLAAVQRQVRIGEVANSWRPALDRVWEFLRKNPGLRTDGHNIFLYQHPENRQLPMNVAFGVEVTREFPPSGEVALVETPTGRAASALHVGPYERMKETHDAIHAWAAANNQTFAGWSWEIYGDWNDDVSKLETRIEYLSYQGI